MFMNGGDSQFQYNYKSKPATPATTHMKILVFFFPSRNIIFLWILRITQICGHKSTLKPPPCQLGSRSRRDNFCLLIDFFIHLCLLYEKRMRTPCLVWSSLSLSLPRVQAKSRVSGESIRLLSIQICYYPSRDKCQHKCVIITICFHGAEELKEDPAVPIRSSKSKHMSPPGHR